MTDELRALARTLFNPDPEPVPPAAPPAAGGNTVPAEGGNPETKISDDAYSRDYARRLFDPDYSATEPQLPED